MSKAYSQSDDINIEKQKVALKEQLGITTEMELDEYCSNHKINIWPFIAPLPWAMDKETESA
ncbi:hypothetical protein [Acetobacterium tundrae]|uniref:Uncharacterized protein n=1 Tax=Acetobacterium tundrae TaxID=132932 RepID=A0ABR6WQI6_9FIRM|nr:hypothetical protein [Acetobacterium tundrae]MBC3798471.1 hypothetical protein [Acetobacterium tundrae]